MKQSDYKAAMNEAKERMNRDSRNGVFESKSLNYYYAQVMREMGYIK